MIFAANIVKGYDATGLAERMMCRLLSEILYLSYTLEDNEVNGEEAQYAIESAL